MSEIQKLRTWLKWQWLDHWPEILRGTAIFVVGAYLGSKI